MHTSRKKAVQALSEAGKTIVVLAVEGIPIDGMPYHNGNGHGDVSLGALLFQARAAERQTTGRGLADNVQTWLRAAQQEPFYVEAHELGDRLSRATGMRVIVGFTQHGIPTLEDALDQAFSSGAEKIVLVNPEMYEGSHPCADDRSAEVNDSGNHLIGDKDLKVSWLVEHLASEL